MTLKNENYVSIIGWMVTLLHLKGNELLVYAIIYGFSQDGESEYTGGYRYLKEWLGLSTETVRKTLSSLLAKGHLEKREIEIANNVKLCRYKAVTPYQKMVGHASFLDGGIPENGTGIPENGTGIPENGMRNNNIYPKDIINNNINPYSPQFCGTDFDRFWKAYPKKVGKVKAQAAFRNVQVGIDTILAAIEKQKQSDQWQRDNGQYIPNPTTWLNQGRWDDELPEAGKTTARDAFAELERRYGNGYDTGAGCAETEPTIVSEQFY